MEYYLFFENSDDYLSIGTDNKMGVFWSDQGLDVINEVVKHKPDLIDKFSIKDEKGKLYSVLQFLDKLTGLQIRTS